MTSPLERVRRFFLLLGAIFVVAIIDLRRDPAAIRRRLELHEEAVEFAAGPVMALPSGISFDDDLKVRLPERFNVAVPFIDRHVAERRSARIAIHTRQESVTYGELAEQVNRAGNALLAAGLICGFLWEFWNYWALTKWTYTVPYFGDIKLFEMPVLGYLGFPPFAIECWAMYIFVRSLLTPNVGSKANDDEIFLNTHQ